MSTPVTRITIGKTGRPKIEGVGFTGTACQDAAKPFIDKLSNGDANTELKPEAAEEGLVETATEGEGEAVGV